MKLTFGKRTLMFFHWLFSLFLCAALALYVIAPELALNCRASFEHSLGPIGVRIVGIALLAIYVALAVFQLMLILNRRKRADRGFITVDSSDTGRVRIAVSAIEQMVRQSVHSIDGITEMNIHIDNLDDAIGIAVNAVIASGSHVPTITMNMQRAIRQFVEVHCGVAVRTISVSINAVSGQQESAHRRRLGWAKPEGRAVQPSPVEKDEIKTDVGSETVPKDAPTRRMVEDLPESDAEIPEVSACANDAAQAVPETNDAGSERPGELSNGATGAVVEADPEPARVSFAYDFDKPYESEFARDLAALKAREASKAKPAYQDEDI